MHEIKTRPLTDAEKEDINTLTKRIVECCDGQEVFISRSALFNAKRLIDPLEYEADIYRNRKMLLYKQLPIILSILTANLTSILVLIYLILSTK